jgi:hypothetical protein
MPLDLDMAILANRPDAEQACRRALLEYAIPGDLHDGLVRYLVAGIRPGSFLSAVLENDLQEAVLRENPVVNFVALPALVRFLHNEAPSAAYGSPEKVTLWSATRRQTPSGA